MQKVTDQLRQEPQGAEDADHRDPPAHVEQVASMSAFQTVSASASTTVATSSETSQMGRKSSASIRSARKGSRAQAPT